MTGATIGADEEKQEGDSLTGKVTLALLAVLGILVAAPAAAVAQASDQYNPLSAPAGPVLDQAGAIASEPGQAGGGELPFTGYPLTPIVLTIALLLAVGLAMRFAAPSLDRRHG